MYDYYLGGKDNFPADREAAEKVIAALPSARANARANRAFLGRAVRYAASLGIDQFLDIGTGIPSPGNTNEVAAEVVADARVVYVDNDPIVLTHARALLAGMDARRRTSVLLGDVREPEKILQQAGELLDFDRPVCLMLVAVLHFVKDEERPAELVRTLLSALAPGSCLILSHVWREGVDEATAKRAGDVYLSATAPAVGRTRAEIETLLEGVELVEPGLVSVSHWRPDTPPAPGATPVPILSAVGLLP